MKERDGERWAFFSEKLLKIAQHGQKIDRSFISDFDVEQSSKTLVDAIIAMAQSLKLEIFTERM